MALGLRETGRVANMAASPSQRSPSYLRRLLPTLGMAATIQGYAAALAVVVQGDAAASFGAPDTPAAFAVLFVGLGAVGGVALAPMADRVGRRPILILSTFMMILLTALTGVAANLTQFALLQFLSRVFVISAYATTLVITVEEFPVGRRGWAVGVVSLFGGLGLALAYGLSALLPGGPDDWKALCFIGLAGLLPLIVIGSYVEETASWVHTFRGEPAERRLGRPHRRQIWQLGTVFFFAYFAFLGGATWWIRFTETEQGIDSQSLGNVLAAAYLIGLAGYLFGGRLQDGIGRRRTATLCLLGAGLAGAGLFTAPVGHTVLASIAVFLGLGASPALSALSAELAPAGRRAYVAGLLRGVFATAGAIGGPVAVSFLADPETGAIGEIAGGVMVVGLAVIPAVLILQLLPETASRDLESIAAAADIPDPDELSSFAPTPAPRRPGPEARSVAPEERRPGPLLAPPRPADPVPPLREEREAIFPPDRPPGEEDKGGEEPAPPPR